MGIAENNLKGFRDYEGALSERFVRSARNESFYRGKQYSRKQRAELKNIGLIPLVVNITRPFISQRRAILTSTKTTWKVVPLQSASKVVAEAANQFLIGKWNADYVDTQLNLAIKDMLITGVGYLFVDLASFLDNATFDISIKHLGWRYVYPDPKCKEFDLSDAEKIYIRKLVGKRRAQVIYNLTDAQALAAIGDKSYGTTQDPEVEVIQEFSKFPVERFEITPKQGEHLRDLPTVFFTTPVDKKIKGEERKYKILKDQLRDDMIALSHQGKIDIRRLRELHVFRSISVGQFDVYEGMMDIRDYPTISFINEIGNRFADHQGDIEGLEGIQILINKFYLLTIQNAMFSGNQRFTGPNDAVKNRTQFQKTASLPGGYLGYDPDPNLPNGGKIEVVPQGNVSPAFFTLQNDLIDKGRFFLSLYGPVMGDASKSPETFSTTASLQEFGTQPIKEIARRVDIQIAKCGEVALQFLQNYTERNQLVEFLDVDLGQSVTPTDANGQPIRLNVVKIKEGVVDEIQNDARLGQFAVKIGTQTNLGTDRLIKAQVLMNMIMNKALPPIPAVINKLIDLLEIPGGAKIMEELNAEASAQSQIKQLTAAMQTMQKQLNIQQNQSQVLRDRVSTKEFENKLNEIVMKADFQTKEGALKIKEFMNELMNQPVNGEKENG